MDPLDASWDDDEQDRGNRPVTGNTAISGGGALAHSRYPLHVFKANDGLPRWLSDKGSTSRCRNHGSAPRSETIPHAAGGLNLWAMSIEWALQSTEAASTEPVRPGARSTAGRRRRSEKPAHSPRASLPGRKQRRVHTARGPAPPETDDQLTK